MTAYTWCLPSLGPITFSLGQQNGLLARNGSTGANKEEHGEGEVDENACAVLSDILQTQRIVVRAGAKEEAMFLSRSEAEKEGSLTFDGFLSFHCKTRADSRSVVSAFMCTAAAVIPRCCCCCCFFCCCRRCCQWCCYSHINSSPKSSPWSQNRLR